MLIEEGIVKLEYHACNCINQTTATLASAQITQDYLNII